MLVEVRCPLWCRQTAGIVISGQMDKYLFQMIEKYPTLRYNKKDAMLENKSICLTG